ncbi:MAG TPA: hypothetical protein VIP70_04405 [Nitrososphaeraceae archaeon]
MCTKFDSILPPRADEVEYKSLESKKQEVYRSARGERRPYGSGGVGREDKDAIRCGIEIWEL